jgi:hypothetical protein
VAHERDGKGVIHARVDEPDAVRLAGLELEAIIGAGAARRVLALAAEEDVGAVRGPAALVAAR